MLFSCKLNHRHNILYILVVTVALPVALFAVANVYAPGDTVTIGEFIFNDDFTPTTDVCTAQVFSPAGVMVANASTTLGTGGWQFYSLTASTTNGTYPAYIVCGSVASGTIIKSEKTFIVKTPDVTNASVASSVWANGTRTITSLGAAAADVWNDSYSGIRRLTDKVLGNGGSLATEAYVSSSTNTIVAEIQTNRSLIQALNNISAADVWAYGTRSLNASTTVNLSNASKQEIWDVAANNLSTSGSIGKRIADNLDVQVSSRGVSNLTAADVWNSTSRTLSDYATTSITNAVWGSASRTLSSYGNDITAADVWNVLSSSVTTTGSIGKQLKDNVDGSISGVVSEIQTNRLLIQALNNISAADVWAHGTRSITGSVNLSTSSKQEIWNVATTDLSNSGSIGKKIVDNLDVQVSSRGISNITAADVWNSASRTLSDYGTSSIAAAVWSNASRTLSSYGNDITAADVWNVLSSSITTVGSIGKQLKDNVNDSISNVIAEVQTNRSLIQSLNDISAADVWSYGARSVNASVDLSTSSTQAIWNVAASGLTTSGSIGKQIKDNVDTQISSRGVSNLTAADVWSSATRSLTDYATTSITAAIWANGSRTLSSYGNDITAADVWNVLSSSITTSGSIGKQLKDNVNDSISNVIGEVLTNRALIASLNNVSAADVWAYGARTITGNVTLSTSSTKAIWDVAASDLSTSGSIGKKVADNLDAQVSSRGVSNLTAADVWTNASRTLSDYATSTITAAIWANSSRTLSNYGNDITAADVWNVLSSSLNTVGSVGSQLTSNVDATVSSRATSSASQNTSNWAVSMSNVERVQTGKVYRTKVFILNNNSNPSMPFSTPTVNLYDESRNLVVSNIPMTLISTGVYEYTYTVSTLAPQGLWETVVSTQVESGKTIQTNDYWEVSGSPAQVIVNSVTSPNPSAISANITITNEGLSGYEYQYEWCIVDTVNNQCGGGDDVFHALAAKFINPGESWNTSLTGNVLTAGTYYFKLVVYFGADSSSASRVFTVDPGTGSPIAGSGSGSSGSGGVLSTPALAKEGCGIRSDLNQDCSVNIVDFSILLSFWKTVPPFKNLFVDINKDDKVNSVDFSIMLSEWSKKK